MAQTVEPTESRPRNPLMSIEAMSAAWYHSKHKSGDLLVLLALCDYANDDGKCWPSETTLARKCRLSIRNVRRCITSLIDSGELTRLTVGSGRTSSLYRINLERLHSRESREDKLSAPDVGVLSGRTPMSSKPLLNHQITKKKEIDKEKRKPPIAKAAALLFGESIGLTTNDVDEWWDYHAADGWMQTKTKPIVDAEASLRTWKRNKIKFARPTATLDLHGFGYGKLCEMS